MRTHFPTLALACALAIPAVVGCRQKPIPPAPPAPPDLTLGPNPMVRNPTAEGAPLHPPPTVAIKDAPRVPFEAIATRETGLFREPEPTDDAHFVSKGTLVTVLADTGPLEAWHEHDGAIVQVSTNLNNRYFIFWPHFAPAPPSVLSAADAGRLTFSSVAAGRRGFCETFADRLLLSSNGGQPATTVVHSSSADDACSGFVSVVTGAGPRARVLASLRRPGPILSLLVRESPGEPPLLELTESLRGSPSVSGLRRVLLAGDGSLRELLSFDVEHDDVFPSYKDTVTSEMTLSPAKRGLSLVVRRKEARIQLPSGTSSSVKESVLSYRYLDGRISPLADTELTK